MTKDSRYVSHGGGKHAKPHRWLNALLDNVEEFARGLGPGIAGLGKAFYNDLDRVTGDALPGHHATSFQFDDIGKAVAQDYKTRYSPLFHGHFKEFENQVATKPLSFIFDTAGILSGGAALAGKAGEAAVIGARGSLEAGSLAAKLARHAGYVERGGMASDGLTNLARAKQVYGATSREVRRGEKAGLVRGVREVGTGAVERGDYRAALLRPAKSNPLLRRRDELVDRVLDVEKLDRVPIVGLASRMAHEDRRKAGLDADVRKRQMLGPAVAAVRKLRPDEQIAWWLHQERIHPKEYVALLETTKEKGLPNVADEAVLQGTLDRVNKPEVMALFEAPNARIEKALEHTRKLADEDMPELVQSLTDLTHRQLLERRLLPQRKLAGAHTVTEHPERVVARSGAVHAVAEGHRGFDDVRLADGPEAADIPGKPSHTGVTPTAEQVSDLLSSEERKLTYGRYSRASGQMKRWLGQFYDQHRYGTKAPDTALKRAEVGKNVAARARAERMAQHRAPTGVTDLLETIDRYGPWSREAARVADDAGHVGRRELWRRLRDARKDKPRLIEQHAPDTLEAKLLEHGYHPSEVHANLPGDDGMAETIAEWIDERTGEDASLVDIAHGVGTEQGTIDEVTARALIEEARHLNPDLPRNPSNSEVAYALSEKFQPFDEVKDVVSKKEWVERAHDAMMRVFIDAEKAVDPDVELAPIRGPIANRLAETFGIRDPEAGIDPSPADWAAAFERAAKDAGFDEKYRLDAKALRGAQARFKEEGPEAFAGAFDREKLDKPELVNPETGRTYADETADMTDEELAALPMGSYMPHLPPSGGRSGGSARATGAVKREPGPAGNLTHQSVGHRLETGNFDMSPLALLQQGDRLVRSKLASDLYGRGVVRGVDFDRRHYLDHGGARRWVILDETGVKGLAARVINLDDTVRSLDEVLGSERVADLVEKLGDMSGELSAKQAEGLRMVPRAYYDRLVGDLQRSNKAAEMLIDRPLDVFRSLVLFARPAYYANNVVGQNMMMAVRDMGPGFIPRYVQFLAHRNPMGARELFRQAATDDRVGYRLWDTVFDKHGGALKGASVGQVEARGMSGGLSRRMTMSSSRSQRVIGHMLRAPETANELGAVLSDDIPRQFRFIRLVMPHVREARRLGEEGTDAEIAMRMLDTDEVLRDRLTQQTLFDLVDYRGMSGFERKVLRRIIPFYGWLRGISTWTAELGYSHPEQMLALAGVSTVGRAENADWNPRVASFLQGSIRIGAEHDGVQRVINTQGLNPLSTIGDIAAMARGALSDDPSRSLAGGTLTGQINPYLKVFAQAALNKGKDFGTGMPMLSPGQSLSQSAAAGEAAHRPGWLGAGLMGWAAGTPQAMLVTQYRTARDNMAAYGVPSTPTAVYQSPFSDYVKSYMGLPIRNVNLAGAMARRQRELETLAGEGSSF